MEAFLLTLDVIAIILLCLAVRKVTQSEDLSKMGWFAYADPKRDQQAATKKDRRASRA